MIRIIDDARPSFRSPASRVSLSVCRLMLTCLFLLPGTGHTDVFPPTAAHAVQEMQIPKVGPARKVRIRGVVTFSHPVWRNLFVEDSSGGVYCDPGALSEFPTAGQAVEVDGTVAAGVFLPIVRVTSLRPLEPAPFPNSRRIGGSSLLSPNLDSSLIRVEGYVISSRLRAHSLPFLQLKLAVDGHRVEAQIFGWEETSSIPEPGTHIALTGVAALRADSRGSPKSVVLLSHNPSLLEILEAAAEWVSHTKVRPIRELWEQGLLTNHPPSRIQGIANFRRTNELYVTDQNAGVHILTPSGNDLAEGDLVDLVILPNHATVERSGELLKVLSHVPKGIDTALPIRSESLRDRNYFGRRVEVEGEFLHRTSLGSTDLLVLKSGHTSFEVSTHFDAARLISQLSAGCKLRVQGVLHLQQGDGGQEPVARLLVSSAASIRVSGAPPWPLEKTLGVVLTLSGLIGVGFISLMIAHQRLRRSNERVAAAEGELKELNWDLERRIASRTTQLERSNDKLKAEIIERKQAQTALADREARLRDAQSIAHLGSYYWDAQSNRTSWSEELFRIYGQTPETFEATYEAYLNQIHPEDRSHVQSTIATVFEGADQFSHTYRIQHRDGKIRWVTGVGRAIRGSQKELLGLEGACQDITETKEAEALRRGQTEVLELIARGAPLEKTLERLVLNLESQSAGPLCSILLLSQDGQYLRHGAAPSLPADYNRQIDGYAIGPSAGSCGTAAFRREVVIVEDIATSPLWAAAKALAESAGLRACWSWPILDAQGQLLGTFALYQREPGLPKEHHRRLVEIATHTAAICLSKARAETLRQELEAKLRQSQKMEAIGTLAGGIAHDFNNILAAIMGYAALAKLDVQNSKDVAGHLEHLQQAAQRARDLIRLILTFSRKEGPRRQPIPLESLLEESLRMLRATLPSQIRINLTHREPVPVVLGDATQIQQVLVNLVNNAAEAIGDKGGSIQIDFGPGLITPTPGSLEKQPYPAMRLTVTDDGPGVDPSITNRIFEPFFTTKGPGKGTGLGLAVVHGIVESHGGILTVESQPGKGSRFVVDLPASKVVAPDPPCQGSEIAEPSVPPRSLPRITDKRILLVDDEISLLKIGENLLKRVGFVVTAFNDPHLAWNAFNVAPELYDVVITDQSMGSMDGSELARKISERHASTPVIICTGHGAGLAAVAEKQKGFRRILHKPYEFQELHDTLLAALNTIDKPTKIPPQP